MDDTDSMDAKTLHEECAAALRMYTEEQYDALLSVLRQCVSALECYEQGYVWSPREASILAAARPYLEP